MNSKEALESFIAIIELIESLSFNNKSAKTKLTKGLYENIAIIKKDLELLDVLKRLIIEKEEFDFVYYMIDDNRLYVDSAVNLTKEEMTKIKEYMDK